MFKYSDLDYDKFYDTKQCAAEDHEIKNILNSVCADGDRVLDIGAGTGLVFSMIGNKCDVTQVEKDGEMKKQNPYPNFVNCDAFEFLNDRMMKLIKFDHVVSLFALNYMRRGTLKKAVERSNGACVFVVYDKPYRKGSASIYLDNKLHFLLTCGFSVVRIKFELWMLSRKGYCVKSWNLLGEPYYKVVVVERS